MSKSDEIANGVVKGVVRLLVWAFILGAVGFMVALFVAGQSV